MDITMSGTVRRVSDGGPARGLSVSAEGRVTQTVIRIETADDSPPLHKPVHVQSQETLTTPSLPAVTDGEGRFSVSGAISENPDDTPDDGRVIRPGGPKRYGATVTVHSHHGDVTQTLTGPTSSFNFAFSVDEPGGDGELVKGSGAPVYLIQGGRRRWVPDPTTLQLMGLGATPIYTLSDGDLAALPEGPPFPSRTDGNHYRGSDPGGFYVMQAGQRRNVDAATRVGLGLGLGPEAFVVVADGDLSAIPLGPPLSWMQEAFDRLRAAGQDPGAPAGDPQRLPGGGVLQRYQQLTIAALHGGARAYGLHDSMCARWAALGGETGLLGAPVEDQRSAPDTTRPAWLTRFEQGAIYLDKATAASAAPSLEIELLPSLGAPLQAGPFLWMSDLGAPPLFAQGKAPPTAPAPYTDSLGGLFTSFGAWVSGPLGSAKVVCRKRGLTLQLGTTAAPRLLDALSAAQILPLRGGVPIARLRFGAVTKPLAVRSWDPGRRVLVLELAFSAVVEGRTVDDPGLRQAVESALQDHPAAMLELSWAHVARTQSAGGGEAAYTFVEAGLPLRQELYRASSPEVFPPEDNDWHWIDLDVGSPDSRRVYYRATERDGEVEYLPTSFQLGMRDDGWPFVPYLHLRDGAGDNPPDEAYRVSLTMPVVPDIAPHHREALRAQLERTLLSPFVRLVPAADLSAELHLDSTGAGAAAQLSGVPQVNLQSGFLVELDVAAASYGLLTKQLSALSGNLSGTVYINLDHGIRPAVPVTLSLPAMRPKVVDLVMVAPAAGQPPSQLVLRNRLKARPVEVSAVTLRLVAEDDLGPTAVRDGVADQAWPLLLPPGASVTVTVRPAAAFAWTRLEAAIDGTRIADPAITSDEDWVSAVNRDFVHGSAANPLTVDIVNWSAITPATHPAWSGLDVSVFPDGGLTRPEALVKSASWTLSLPLSLVQVAESGRLSVRYEVEHKSVYAGADGLPQRTAGEASGASSCLVRALPLEQAGTLYDVLGADGTTLGQGLSRDDARAVIDRQRAKNARWSLVVRG